MPPPLDIGATPAARPWYRGLCNLETVLEFREKPLTAAFHLVSGEWNLDDWEFCWCPDKLEPLVNKIVHFSYVYVVCLFVIFLGYLVSKLPTIKQVREWWAGLFRSAAPNSEV